MLVMCPASLERRRKNKCGHTCSHFHPHVFCDTATKARDACHTIMRDNGEVLCPQCVEATKELKNRVYRDATIMRITNENV